MSYIRWSAEERMAVVESVARILVANSKHIDTRTVRAALIDGAQQVLHYNRRKPSFSGDAVRVITTEVLELTAAKPAAFDNASFLDQNVEVAGKTMTVAQLVDAHEALLLVSEHGKQLVECLDRFHRDWPGANVFKLAEERLEEQKLAQAKATEDKGAPKAQIVVAGVHTKFRPAVEIAVPGTKITWIEDHEALSLVRFKAQGRHCIACSYGSSNTVRNAIRDVSYSFTPVDNSRNVGTCIQNLIAKLRTGADVRGVQA